MSYLLFTQNLKRFTKCEKKMPLAFKKNTLITKILFILTHNGLVDIFK